MIRIETIGYRRVIKRSGWFTLGQLLSWATRHAR
jgi:hypothetical protein